MTKPSSRRRRKAKPTPEDVVNRLATRNAPNTLATWLEDLAECLETINHPILMDGLDQQAQGQRAYDLANGLYIRARVCLAFAGLYPDLLPMIRATMLPLVKAIRYTVTNSTADLAQAQLRNITYSSLVMARLQDLSREHGPAIRNLADDALAHDMMHGDPGLPPGMEDLPATLTMRQLAERLDRRPVWSRWLPLAQAARICGCDFRTLRKNERIPHERRHNAARRWRFSMVEIEAQFGKRIANKMRENTK